MVDVPPTQALTNTCNVGVIDTHTESTYQTLTRALNTDTQLHLTYKEKVWNDHNQRLKPSTIKHKTSKNKISDSLNTFTVNSSLNFYQPASKRCNKHWQQTGQRIIILDHDLVLDKPCSSGGWGVKSSQNPSLSPIIILNRSGNPGLWPPDKDSTRSEVVIYI